MKAYTDLEQSKKLAKILPIESADMHYVTWTILENGEFEVSMNQTDTIKSLQEEYGKQIIPCWSIAALLNVLPVSCDDGQHCLALINPNPNDKTEWLCAYEDCKGDLIMECYADNSVDACYEMILNLKEKNII